MTDSEKVKPRVIVVDETSENERLSALIREKLLEQERIPRVRQEKEPEKAPQKEDEEAAQSPGKRPNPGPSEEALAGQYEVVNVNEKVLENMNVPGVMEKMGCCMCPRCQADVMALTLSLLTPQYCIGVRGSGNSFVGYYQNRHQSRILAQLQLACERVKDHPRHDRQS